MEAFILGCGGMMPLPGRFLTSVLLRRDSDLFLFDCGEATQVAIRKLRLRWKSINTIFISHTHADHVTGLPGLFMLSSQVEREEPLTIIGPPRICEYVEANCRVLEMHLNYEILVKEIARPHEETVVYETEQLTVRSIPLKHSRICVGYVLEEKARPGIFYPEKADALGVPRGPERAQLQRDNVVILPGGQVIHPAQVMGPKREGRKFSYVTDTAYKRTISKAVSHSDLLICEGMFDHSLIDSAGKKKHLTARQAGRIAKEAGGIKKMGLIHYSPRYTDGELQTLLVEAKTSFPSTFLCRDRLRILLPNRGEEQEITISRAFS